MAQSDNTDSHLILYQTNKGIIFRKTAFDIIKMDIIS